MKIKNLTNVYIYRRIPIKKDGESFLKWTLKEEKRLNVQQDVSSLDVNQAGVIDFDRIKIRTDYEVDINKKDGISLELIETGEDGYTTKPPMYEVTSKIKVGNSITWICDMYHGE